MDGRMGSPYDQSLGRLSAAMDLPEQMSGSSGYFSKPTPDLDPRLFPPGSDSLIPSVRRWILAQLYDFWVHRYRYAHRWSTVWIAGSGITSQWSGGRAVGDQPGDLDVLIGIDWPQFMQDNPQWRGTSDAGMAEQMNAELHVGLWPQTANVVLPTGGAPFEVTYFINATAADIRVIYPYAAYNVSSNSWTVHPIELPEDWDPITAFPKDWQAKFNDEAGQAADLVHSYRTLRRLVATSQPGGPAWLNNLVTMHHVVRVGRDLFDSIHGERHNAFGPDGQGYGDYYNARWQFGKWHGTVGVTHQFAKLDADVHKDITARCYDGPFLDAHHALILAQQTAGREI